MKKVARDTTPTKKSPVITQPKSPIGGIPAEDKTRIFIRVRPLLNTEELNGNLTIKDHTHIRMIKSDFESVKMKFDGIFNSNFLQKDIFSTFEPSIKGFLNGENHCFFAYGQTGAGKTYTMMGDFEEKATDFTKFLTNESRGILPRALSEILQYLQNKKCRLWAAFYEIYNDKIYDLLNAKTRQKKGGLDFRENANGSNMIIDLQQFEINSINDMLECLRVGIQNRATGSTHGNQKSSRSHSIFQLKLVQADPQDPAKTMISQLKIIDLAGSEKFIISKDLTSEERELRITELTSINSSLSTLGLCVSALTEPNRSHIPLRNSKLTRVLSDTLNGTSKITFIVCISAAKESSNETLSTLQFASRAKKIVLEGRPTSKALDKKTSPMEHGLLQEMCDIDAPKKQVNLELEIQQLRQQNEDLKEQLKKMERSLSPKKQTTKTYTSQSAVKTPIRRSVSPYSASAKKETQSRENNTPTTTKKSEIKRVPHSHGKQIETRDVTKNRNFDLRASVSSANRISKGTIETRPDVYSSKSPLRTGNFNTEYRQDTQNSEEYVAQKQRIYHSDDLRKAVKREEPSKSTASPKQRLPPAPLEDVSPAKIQHLLQKTLSPARDKTPDCRDQPSGSHLYEWGGVQDSRCLKENEQMGLPEMSAILPNQFNSCTSSEAETLLTPQGDSSKKIPEETNSNNNNNNNLRSQFSGSKSQHIAGPIVQKNAPNSTTNAPRDGQRSSMDSNGEEIIRESNRKLSSVQQLNQQHIDLIKTLSSKLEETNPHRWTAEPRTASKSPNNKEKPLSKNEVKRMTPSPIKAASSGGNIARYNSAKQDTKKLSSPYKSPSELNHFCSVQGKHHPENNYCTRTTTAASNVGSITTTNTTGSFEKEGRKSENLFDSKSILDIITRHWDTYKDNMK